MSKILTLLLLSTFYGAEAFGHTFVCDQLLGDSGYRMTVRQISKLNPEILSGEAPVLTDLYLALKRESESYERAEIPEALAEHLRAAHAEHFAVEGLDRHQLTLFYRNSLRALVHRVAGLWRLQEVRTLAGLPLAPEAREFAGHLLDSFFSPYALHDQEMSLSEAARYFRERPWAGFNWPSSIAGDMDAFDWNDRNRIRLARLQTKRAGECCLSESGCTLCPHNRAWLKR